LKESAPLLYGKAYTPVAISVNIENTLARLRTRQKRGLDLGMAIIRDELERCARDVTVQATKAAKGKLERYRKNYHTFLTSQAIMQGISKDTARLYAAEQVDKRGDTLYTDGKMMLLLMDKIVKFDRTDKTRRNPTIADTTLAEEDPAVIEAVKADKKKGKGRARGWVRATSRTPTLLPPLLRPPRDSQQSSANSATRLGTSRASATRNRTWRNSGTRWSAQLPSSRSQLSRETATGDGGRASPYR
jgi:hypothetical protein